MRLLLKQKIFLIDGLPEPFDGVADVAARGSRLLSPAAIRHVLHLSDNQLESVVLGAFVLQIKCGLRAAHLRLFDWWQLDLITGIILSGASPHTSIEQICFGQPHIKRTVEAHFQEVAHICFAHGKLSLELGARGVRRVTLGLRVLDGASDPGRACLL